jgi:hypothetical protein
MKVKNYFLQLLAEKINSQILLKQLQKFAFFLFTQATAALIQLHLTIFHKLVTFGRI